MTSLVQDLRQALRKLARSPGFTAAVVLTLALGIGANGAVFSLVRGVLLRPLPYEQPEELVRVLHAHEEEGSEPGVFSPPDREDLQRSVDARAGAAGAAFAATGAFWFTPGHSGMNLTGDGQPLMVQAAFVSHGFFPTLGVPAAHGRTFRPEENVEGRDRVVVLSDGFWHRRFAGDPAAVGETLHLDGEAFTVVGVMPRGFGFPSEDGDVWVPLSLITEDSIPTFRALRWEGLVARLAPGVTPAAAEGAVEAVLEGLAREYPDSNAGWTDARAVPLRETIVGEVRPALLVLATAVGLVLLIACANLANLFLARALGRERELALRSALGAARPRLVRQLLVESVVVAALGGGAGLALAAWAPDALLALQGGTIPRAGAVRLDGAVVGFTLALSLVTGLAFGILPALRASGVRLSPALAEGGAGGGLRRGSRAGAAFVVVQTAIAVVLLVGALLLMRGFLRLLHEDPGFRAEGVLALSLTAPPDKYPDREDREPYRQRLLERVAAIPGVVAVGGSKTMPLQGGGEPYDFEAPGRPGDRVQPESGAFIVTPGYFRTLGIPLLDGRDFTWADGTEGRTPTLIVNRRLARQLWGREDVVGETLALGEEAVWPVVGVVDDVRSEGLATPPGSAVYLPSRVFSRSTMKLFVRTAGDPLAQAEAVRAAVREIEADQPISELATLRSVVAAEAAQPRLLAVLVTGFATLAALLAAVGLYGVVAYTVGRRTREIGIRMALGAGRGAVLAAVVGRSLALTGAGLVLGLAGAWSAAGLLASQLYEVDPGDPATFAAVAALMLLAGFAAAYVPARRAARVDPMIALRQE
jgi:predicted permease